MVDNSKIRWIQLEDLEFLRKLVYAEDVFTREEKECLIELLHDAVYRPEEGYEALVYIGDGIPIGVIVFGKIPLTDRNYDLYWILVHPHSKGKGIGKALLQQVEVELKKRGVRKLFVETSSLETYSGARQFYQTCRFQCVARVPDFYKEGDDKLIYEKQIS